MRRTIDAIVINGYELPAMDEGVTFEDSTYGKFERNANNGLTGQKVGRPLIKLDPLQWAELPVEQWAAIKQAIEPFFVMVTLTTDTNERITLKMYPSNRKATPCDYDVTTKKYKRVKNCKFNLIDCGWDITYV